MSYREERVPLCGMLRHVPWTCYFFSNAFLTSGLLAAMPCIIISSMGFAPELCSKSIRSCTPGGSPAVHD
jgi:hypothetical protein